MKLLMVGLLFSLVLLWSSGANAESAQNFLAGCRRIVEAPTSDGKVTLSGDVSEHRCWGAFAVLQELQRWKSDGKRLLGACPPATSTRTQLIAIFVEYLNRRPERRHEDFVLVALDSLRSAFPCNRSQ